MENEYHLSKICICILPKSSFFQYLVLAYGPYFEKQCYRPSSLMTLGMQKFYYIIRKSNTEIVLKNNIS